MSARTPSETITRVESVAVVMRIGSPIENRKVAHGNDDPRCTQVKTLGTDQWVECGVAIETRVGVGGGVEKADIASGNFESDGRRLDGYPSNREDGVGDCSSDVVAGASNDEYRRAVDIEGLIGVGCIELGRHGAGDLELIAQIWAEHIGVAECASNAVFGKAQGEVGVGESEDSGGACIDCQVEVDAGYIDVCAALGEGQTVGSEHIVEDCEGCIGDVNSCIGCADFAGDVDRVDDLGAIVENVGDDVELSRSYRLC